MTQENQQVHDDEAAHRYELRMDGHLAVLEYERSAGRVRLIHTRVPPAIEHHGAGSRLAQAALDDARDRGLIVVPICPFVRSYLQDHPEYLPLVEAGFDMQGTRPGE